MTGAGTGIGAAIAVAIGAAGARVALHYNTNKAGAEKVSAEIRAQGGADALLLQADLLDGRAVAGMLRAVSEKLGRIDILVNSSGGLVERRVVEERSDETYAPVMAPNIVSALTRGVAKELAPFGIRVNAIAPGIVLTSFHDKYTTPELLARLVRAIPLGRGATAEEMAEPALFPASDQMSSFITGEVIEVNGGALMS